MLDVVTTVLQANPMCGHKHKSNALAVPFCCARPSQCDLLLAYQIEFRNLLR